MSKGLFTLILMFAVGVAAAVGQEPARAQALQIPEVEGFRLVPGSSFEASGSGTVRERSGEAESRSKIASDVREALELIRRSHVDGAKISSADLGKSSIKTMLSTLDPHSSYFDSAEYKELLDEQQSEYSGIGATIANYNKDGVTDTYILATTQGSPAGSSSLRYGDRIVSVDGETMGGKTSDYVRDKVRGRNGSVVRLQIERADGRVETVEIRRGLVSQPTIGDAYMLRPGIGYIDLSGGFNYTTSGELNTAIRSLKRQGMKSLVLDLRENTGGILEQAVKVAEKFLPAGSVIVSQRGRSRIDNRTWRSANRSPETMPLVLLVNENSASASEVVAGALQDHDRALIVGERTFGKGLVQSVMNLPGGAGLTLTTAKYFTPSGRSIQRDYTVGNLYDYYAHRNDTDASKASRPEARTAANRKVFGGDGIDPDEMVAAADMTPQQLRLLDKLFLFSRIAASKRPAGQAASAVGDDIVDQFIAFAGGAEALKSERKFIQTRIKYNLVMAQAGTAAANRVLTEDDEQTAKGVEALPRAQQLAHLARQNGAK